MDPVIETINTYDKMADDYKRRYQKYGDQNHMKPLLEKFIELLGKRKNVLDIGSGAGFDAKYLSDSGYQVTSIDLSEKLLEIARDIAPKARFLKMDVRKLDFDAESFDGVWASASLLHLPKNQMKSVISNIYRTLKPQGIFFLGLKKGEGEGLVENKGEGNLPSAKKYFSYYSKEEIDELLLGKGFRLVEYSTDENRGNVWMRFFYEKN